MGLYCLLYNRVSVLTLLLTAAPLIVYQSAELSPVSQQLPAPRCRRMSAVTRPVSRPRRRGAAWRGAAAGAGGAGTTQVHPQLPTDLSMGR